MSIDPSTIIWDDEPAPAAAPAAPRTSETQRADGTLVLGMGHSEPVQVAPVADVMGKTGKPFMLRSSATKAATEHGNAEVVRTSDGFVARPRAPAAMPVDSGIDLSTVTWDDEATPIDLSTVTWDDELPKQDGSGFLRGVNDPREWGRQLALTGRAAASGIAAIPETLVNGVTGAVNAVAGTNIPRARIGDTLDYLGVAQPQNSTERVAQDVAGGLASTVGTAGIGLGMAGAKAVPVVGAIPGAESGLAQGIGRTLTAAPIGQAAATVGGTAAGGIARENDVGPGGQLLASLTGSMGPGLAYAGSAGAVRGAMRGGEAGRQRMADNIQTFERAGTTPTVGQASEGRAARAAESLLSRTPGGAGVMNRKAEQQAEQISSTVDRIADRLAPGAGPVEAGESIMAGLERAKRGIKTLQTHLYGKLDGFIPGETPITVARTKQALSDLNSDIQGAPALGKMFQNSRIQGIERALQNDLDAVPNPMGSLGGTPPPAAATMPYTSIKKLRTLVGKEIDNANFTSDVPRDKWRALYAALSDDLGDAAERAGPEAAASWRWANQFTKTQTARLEEMSKIAGKEAPEQVFNASLLGTRDGDTIVRRVVDLIPKENRKDLASAVIRRMGRALPGHQNDVGDAFSTSTFLTNWSRLSPEARQTIFGRVGDGDLLDELASIAKVGSNIRDGSKVFANPSGTAGAAATQGLLYSGVTAAATGHPGVAAAAAGFAAGGNLAARLLASPRVTAWLAQQSHVPRPAGPAGINASAISATGSE